MGKKKHNICSKCGVRHAAPKGKACLAGAGKQAEEWPIEDEIIQGGQAPNQVGLDGLCDPPDRRKAVSSDERIDKMERDMTTMGGKLDLILTSMKKCQVSDNEEIAEGWTKDISDAWNEVKGRGRPRHKPVKPMKPNARHRKSSSSSDDSSTASLEREGDTKIQNNSSLLVFNHISCVILNFMMYVGDILINIYHNIYMSKQITDFIVIH